VQLSMGGSLQRRGAGALYRLSNKSFGFPRGWGGVTCSSFWRTDSWLLALLES